MLESSQFAQGFPSGAFAGAFGREGAQPPPDLSPFRTGLLPVFTLLPVREGAGGEQLVPVDDGGCNRGHFCPIKGISRKRLLRAEKLFSPFRTGKHWPGPSDYGKACRERTRGEWEARDKLPAPFRGRRRRVRRCTSGSCLILSRQSGLQILTAPHAGPKRAPPAATRRRHKNGRPAQSYRGIQKPHGRPPAGSIKGAALRIFTSITQRQQGLPRPVRRPLYKMENRRYNRKRNAPSFRLLMEVCASVCRGRVCYHPFLHCTFLCAYNQIIPLFPRLSRQRDAASPARRGERRKPIAYFAGTV